MEEDNVGKSAPLLMIVEDNNEIRTLLSGLLEDEGYRVLQARNGHEALERLQTRPRPALIFLDMMMPIMDGPTFRKRQLEDPTINTIPVIAMTAGGRPLAAWFSCDEVIFKPMGMETVLAAIHRHCSVALN